jgi:hypothetical protein
MKTPKDEKIQVLLSSTDHHKLKNIILQHAINNGKLVTVSSYVRELILGHIREYEGEQTSFVDETVKEIIEKTKENKK